MCDIGSSAASLSNAQRAHDLALQCISNLTLTRSDDLQLISDEYLKKYLFFWEALNDFVRKQSDEITKEQHHHPHEHGHGEHHHHHHLYTDED